MRPLGKSCLASDPRIDQSEQANRIAVESPALPIQVLEASAQSRFANRSSVQLTCTEKCEKPREPPSQCLGQFIIFGESLVFEPQTQDDKGVGRSVQLAVKAPDEPVAPQNG